MTVASRLAAISLRQILRLLLLRCRCSRAKDLELLVLRQELDVLHRQVPRPRFRPEERSGALRPPAPAASAGSCVVSITPDTIRRSSIIACDLFTVASVRLKTLYVLFFIDLHTVLIGGVTDGAANAAWCAKSPGT